MSRAFLLLSILVVTIVSCKKYEDGPNFSLRSKKARISGEWKIDQITFNGDDITQSVITNMGSDYVLTINKNETYHSKGMYVDDQGTWKLGHEKGYLMMLSDIPGSEELHYEILKLENKKLWIKHTHETHVTEAHYVAK